MKFHTSSTCLTSKLFLEVPLLLQSVPFSIVLCSNMLAMDMAKLNKSWERLENVANRECVRALLDTHHQVHKTLFPSTFLSTPLGNLHSHPTSVTYLILGNKGWCYHSSQPWVQLPVDMCVCVSSPHLSHGLMRVICSVPQCRQWGKSFAYT